MRSTPARTRHALILPTRTPGPRCARYSRMAWIYTNCYVTDGYADGHLMATSSINIPVARPSPPCNLRKAQYPHAARPRRRANGSRRPGPDQTPNGQPGVVPCVVERRNAISSSCSRCTPGWSARADRPRSARLPVGNPAPDGVVPVVGRLQRQATVVPAAGRLLQMRDRQDKHPSTIGAQHHINAPSRMPPKAPATPSRCAASTRPAHSAPRATPHPAPLPARGAGPRSTSETHR